MLAESGGNPNAVSPTNDHGLFQINNGLVSFGSQIYDPEANIRIAYQYKYLPHGFAPWTTYCSGSYKKYL